MAEIVGDGRPWTVQVGWLRCLRGVDTLTAVGLCAQIGDFERFAKPGQLMSWEQFGHAADYTFLYEV